MATVGVHVGDVVFSLVYWNASVNVWNFGKIAKETPAVRWRRPSLSKLAW